MKSKKATISFLFWDIYSGIFHLITNTFCFIAQTVVSSLSFILFYGYHYLIYNVFNIPRPKRTSVNEKTRDAPQPPPSFDPKMLRKRQYAIDELIASEYKYEKNLNAIIKIYEPAYRPILSEDDMYLFFGQIHPLIELSHRVAAIFEAQCKGGAKEAKIGNLFLHKLDLAAGFSQFISTYLEINSKFTELLNTNQDFVKLNQDLEKSNEPFSSLILLPLQRMPKYLSIVNEIISSTPDWHNDYHPLKEAETKLLNDSQVAENCITEANRRSKLMEMVKPIRNCPDLISDPHRNLLGRFEPREDQTILYLLTDMIIITKENNEPLSRKTYQEIQKIIDLNIITGTERVSNGILLKSVDDGILIEIDIKAKELKDGLDQQIYHIEQKKKEEEERHQKEIEMEKQRQKDLETLQELEMLKDKNKSGTASTTKKKKKKGKKK